MTIGCIGWGSLVYEPRQLKVPQGDHPEDNWCPEGPHLPIEFARHSTGNRITLVLLPGSQNVKTLWNTFTVHTLEAARESLREREGISSAHATEWISEWSTGQQPATDIEKTIASWANRIGLQAAVWTNLPSKWAGEVGRVPRQDEVLEFIDRLSTADRARAERYIRMAPRQIDTPYRQVIASRFGWTPIGRI